MATTELKYLLQVNMCFIHFNSFASSLASCKSVSIKALDIKSDLFKLSALSPDPPTLGSMSSSLSPLPLPVLTSALMDITFPFLHLCTQSVPASGKVSHQYILQLHSSRSQIGEIINTTARRSPLCRNQSNQVAMTRKLFVAVYHWLFAGLVCFSIFRGCKVSIELKIQCLWPGGSWTTAIY